LIRDWRSNRKGDFNTKWVLEGIMKSVGLMQKQMHPLMREVVRGNTSIIWVRILRSVSTL
jgi:hypothetical protein